MTRPSCVTSTTRGPSSTTIRTSSTSWTPKQGVLLAVDGAILVILATSPAAIKPGLEQLALGAALLLIGISAIFGFLIIKPRVYKGNPGTKIFYSAILLQTRE